MPHGFKVIGDAPARMLLMTTPGGFERFIVELSEAAPAAPDMSKLLAAAARYQIDIHGPLPESPEGLASRAMPTADLKSLNHRWVQAFNERDWEMERAIRTPDFQAHLSGAPEPLGAEAWSAFFAAFTQAFPDSRITIGASIAEGDMVATQTIWCSRCCSRSSRALRAGRLREPDKLAQFVLGTCRVTVIDVHRSAQRQRQLLEEFGAILVPDQVPMPNLDVDRLARCVQALKERERSVVVMTFYDEHTAEHVARVPGISEANARVIRHRALKQLRG